ncbi:MAG: winged helix-turn-helix transcriptional regulator [Myxococcales bacterium]|nr:winged helix-turn-helix transcriptional regulator [Myxococcales bacterium]
MFDGRQDTSRANTCARGLADEDPTTQTPAVMAHDPAAEDILRAIRRIIRRVSFQSRDLAAATGLTMPQLLCLRAIERFGSTVTVAMLAAELHLSPSTVSGIVDRLVRSGFVERERSDVDRRRWILTPTVLGQQRLDTVPIALQDRFVRRLGQLDHAERRQLLGALERVVTLLDAEALDAAPMLVPGESVTSD